MCASQHSSIKWKHIKFIHDPGRPGLFHTDPVTPSHLVPFQVKKKKAFEDLAQHLRTDDNKIATYQGKPITTSAGACTTDNVAGGTLS